MMDIKKCTGLAGENRDYYLYPKAEPPFERSDYIEEVLLDSFRYHSGEGGHVAADLGKGRLHVLWCRRQQRLSDKHLEDQNHALCAGRL